MRLFGRKNAGHRCPECRFYAMVEGYGYCARGVPSHIDVRFLSQEGLKRQCSRCPEDMTCGDWQAK